VIMIMVMMTSMMMMKNNNDNKCLSRVLIIMSNGDYDTHIYDEKLKSFDYSNYYCDDS
jgi:hypothetical protein